MIRQIFFGSAILLGVCSLFACSDHSQAREELASSTSPVSSEVAIPGDLYKGYAEVLSEFVDDKGLVYYRGLQQSRDTLDAFAKALGSLNPATYEQFSDTEKIVFWTNAYNALTLVAIIDNYPIKSGFFSSLAFPKNSIRQISGVWDKLQFQVMGKPHTLNQIEHEILRKQFSEPRVHMALVCAALSCPRLRNEPYIAERLEEQFRDQTKEFMANSTRFGFPKDGAPIRLSKIFEWFGEDFVAKYKWRDGNPGYGEKEGAVIAFLAQHLPEEQAKTLRSKKFDIEYLDYDWTLNERSSK